MDRAAHDSVRESALWQRLRVEADAGAREELLDLHMPYARVVAASYFSRRFHEEIEFNDYLQYASVGLLEAMERFDPGRGVQFRTFAARRMHGAILSGIERMTEKQQQIAARQRIRAERLADVKALAQGDDAESQEPRRLMQFVSDVGMGLALCWLLEGTGLVDDPRALMSMPFYQSAATRQLRERLLHAIDALPGPERTVIRSHYLHDLPFESVASSLQLTRGRISQIHKQALLHLRSLVREHADWSASF